MGFVTSIFPRRMVQAAGNAVDGRLERSDTGRFGHPGSQHAKHRNPRDGNRLQPARSD